MPPRNHEVRDAQGSGQARSPFFYPGLHPGSRRLRRIAEVIFLTCLATWATAGKSHIDIRDSGLFSEKGLERRVDFWEAVFTRHGRNHALLHDRQEVGLVYEVVALEGDAEHDEAAWRAQQRIVKERTASWEDRLRTLARSIEAGASPGASDLELLSLIQTHLGVQAGPQLLEDLAGRLHVQRGVRELYGEGWVRSGRYLPHMQAIFSDMGVPDEILAIPFFESSFRTDSRSRKQATGVWQFIRSTGKLFLKIDRHFDERLDPLLSTRGAGRFLLDARRKLGSWPLAVMAYNHGLYGIMRAKSSFGNDPLTIIHYYSSSQFGYASRNYYPEFLAALRLLRDPEDHFSGDAPEAPWAFREIPLARKMTVAAVLKKHQVNFETFLDLNPSVIRQRAHLSSMLPAGFRLRLPADTPPEATARTPSPEDRPAKGAKPAATKPAAPPPAPSPAPAKPAPGAVRKSGTPVRTHVVQPGETLYRLSVMYKTSVSNLRRWNKLPDNTIRSGQRLIVGQ